MLQITYRNMPSSATVRDLAEQKLARLDESAPASLHCHLVVEHRPSRARKDEQFYVHAELTCGADARFAATATHEQACTAVRLAIEHVERQLASRRARLGARVA